MKYLLSLTFIALLFISCSKENVEQENNADLTYQADTNALNYKGIFATLDSKHRATVDMTIPLYSLALQDVFPTATLTFPNGKTLTAISDFKYAANESIENVIFSGNGLSFSFSSGINGENALITNAVYNTVETSIKIAQVRQGDPLPATFTGTYTCDDCATHPVLGSGASQTFNVMIANGGFGATTDVTTQIILGSTDFGSATGNEQMDCEGVGDSATSCPINGSSFNNLIVWDGIHYSDFAEGCDGVSGTWDFDSPNHGMLNGTFTSDNACVLTTTFIDESFETPVAVAYTASPADDMTEGQFDDYYGIVAPGAVAMDIVINNIDGANYYGAQDTNGAAVPTDDITLLWTGFDVSEISTVDFSGFFAEDMAGNGDNDWDSTSSVRLEYAIDGGTWTPVIAFEAELVTPGDFTNEFARLDTDFDGLGDGQALNDILTEFTASASVTGALMDVRIFITGLNDGDEDVAIDKIVVTGM